MLKATALVPGLHHPDTIVRNCAIILRGYQDHFRESRVSLSIAPLSCQSLSLSMTRSQLGTFFNNAPNVNPYRMMTFSLLRQAGCSR
jgi:hypothetical protein